MAYMKKVASKSGMKKAAITPLSGWPHGQIVEGVARSVAVFGTDLRPIRNPARVG